MRGCMCGLGTNMYNSLMAASLTTSTFGFIHGITVQREGVGRVRKDVFFFNMDRCDGRIIRLVTLWNTLVRHHTSLKYYSIQHNSAVGTRAPDDPRAVSSQSTAKLEAVVTTSTVSNAITASELVWKFGIRYESHSEQYIWQQ